jgi:von Willebrand factor type A domain
MSQSAQQIDSQFANSPWKSWSAGLSSLFLHFILFSVGVMCLRGLSPHVTGEPERNVAIVLATVEQAQTEYFSEQAVTESQQAVSNAATTQEAVANALPNEALPATLPTIALPGAENFLPSENALATANVSGGTSGKPIVDPSAGVAEIMAAEARRVKKAGPVGEPVAVSVFGLPPTPGYSFLFLLDRSKSMGADGLGVLSAAESELTTALKNLQANHSFQIVAYNEGTQFLSERKMLPATPENIQKGVKFLHDMLASGPTDHTRALLSALRTEPDIIFLFTDGDDPYISEKQRLLIAQAAGKTCIHCVQFGRGKPIDNFSRECLQALAKEHGGSYTFIDMLTWK